MAGLCIKMDGSAFLLTKWITSHSILSIQSRQDRLQESLLLVKAKKKIAVIGLIPNEILTKWLKLKPLIVKDSVVSDTKGIY